MSERLQRSPTRPRPHSYYPPAPSPSECLPHDKAVWREHDRGDQPPVEAAGRRVSADYGDGCIALFGEQDTDWRDVGRWRFGWPPRD